VGEVRLAFNPAIDLGRGHENTLEYAIKAAASVAARCAQDGIAFRLWPSPKDIRGTQHSILRFLAGMESHERSSVHQALDAPGHPAAAVLVLSAADHASIALVRERQTRWPVPTVMLLEGFGPEEDAEALAALAQSGVRVVACRTGALGYGLGQLSLAISRRDAAVPAHHSGRHR